MNKISNDILDILEKKKKVCILMNRYILVKNMYCKL